MNTNIKEELFEIVKNSRLEPTQKSIWEIFLEVANDEQTQPILDLIKTDEKHLKWLTENIRDKFWAMKNLDKKMFDGIIAKEREYLLNN